MDFGLNSVLDVEFAILDLLGKEGYEPSNIEWLADPALDGVFAVRVQREGLDNFDCIVNLDDGIIDEVEFDCWPPTAGNLKFFL